MHIVIVSHFYPPLNAIASLRPRSFARFFVSQGHKVTVLTTQKYPADGGLDLADDIDGNLNIIEVPYRPLFFWKKRAFPSTRSKGGGAIVTERKQFGLAASIKAKLKQGVDRLGFLLDHQFFWTKPALKELEKLVESEQVDAVLSTFSPASSHKIASQLVRRYPHLKWVADYRDLWSQNHILAAKGIFRPIERYVERSTIKYAHHLTTVSAPLAEDLIQFTAGKQPVSVIYNGYDSHTLLESAPQVLNVKDVIRIVYTGTIYKGRRDPTPLLIALNELEKEGLVDAKKVRIEFYGSANDNLVEIATACNGLKWIDIKGLIPYEEAIQVQREASFLLFLESGAKDARGVLTGKLFEYLIAHKPILGVGIDAHSATGRLIQDTHTGVVFGVDDQAVKTYLKGVLEGNNGAAFKPDWAKIKQYNRDVQAQNMLDIIIREVYAK